MALQFIMRKKGAKKGTSLRRYGNLDYLPPESGDVEEDMEDDEDPEVRALTRKLESEGIGAILDYLKKSFAKLGDRAKTENAAGEEPSKF